MKTKMTHSVPLKLAVAPNMTMLNDQGILAAINNNFLTISPKLQDDQLQPGSLDARIGQVYVYDEEYRRTKYEEFQRLSPEEQFDASENPSRKGSKHFPDEKDIPILLPPRSFAEVYIHEQIAIKDDIIYLSHELRSSRGRLQLFPQGIFLEEDSDGKYIGVHNLNPNPIILYGQSKFANIFMHPRYSSKHSGSLITDSQLIEKYLKGTQALVTPEGYLEFRAGKEMKVFKRNGTIDTAKSIDESIYETIDLSKGHSFASNSAGIIQLEPKLELPPNVGIRLMHQIPFHQSMQEQMITLDWHQVTAGWVDQGYHGSITAHPMRFIKETYFKEGDTICFGMVYLFKTNSQRAYGSAGLNSHYQNSSGATASKS